MTDEMVAVKVDRILRSLEAERGRLPDLYEQLGELQELIGRDELESTSKVGGVLNAALITTPQLEADLTVLLVEAKALGWGLVTDGPGEEVV